MINLHLVTQWFTIALSDLSLAKFVYENMYPKPLAQSCYHCQQAAEKALKGYLQYKEQDPPQIHDLRVLCKLCMKLDTSFETIVNAALALNPYGVTARYPSETIIDEKITQTVIVRAQTVYDFALSKVPELKLDEGSLCQTH